MKIENNSNYSIKKPYTTLYKHNTENSNKETEALFGECFLVKKVLNDWVFGKLINDGYTGWLKSNSFNQILNPTHKVIVPSTNIYQKPEDKSLAILNLPFNSYVKVILIQNDWMKIKYNCHPSKYGFVPSHHLCNIKNKFQNWIKFSNFFKNSPYKWGGKTISGIDCSGLVQILLQQYLDRYPRNTSQQIKIGNEILNFTKNNNLNYVIADYLKYVKTGDLIFWKGHVAIALNNKEIIHASSNKMITCIENFEDVYERLIRKKLFNISIKRL